MVQGYRLITEINLYTSINQFSIRPSNKAEIMFSFSSHQISTPKSTFNFLLSSFEIPINLIVNYLVLHLQSIQATHVHKPPNFFSHFPLPNR